MLATVTGQPATAFPAGVAPGGLTVGLQAIGPYLEDRTPLRFAALLADLAGASGPRPGSARECNSLYAGGERGAG